MSPSIEFIYHPKNTNSIEKYGNDPTFAWKIFKDGTMYGQWTRIPKKESSEGTAKRILQLLSGIHNYTDFPIAEGQEIEKNELHY